MKRRITWFALTLILAMAMIGSSAFAEIPVTQNQNKDIDHTTEGANGRMAQSTNTAELKLDKTFEKFGTTWPNKDSFDYTIEAINSWDNSNKDTAQNGTVGETAKMPKPYIDVVENGQTKKQKLTSAGDNKWKATVGLGAEDGNGTTGADQAGKDSNVNSAKIGNQIVKFDFTRPGYYIYKVTEVDDEVAGVTYDKHVYYIAFYVANKTEGKEQNGETLGGDENEDGSQLYVHTITAWRSQATGGTNVQIFENVVIPKSVDPSFKTSNQYYLLVKKGKETEAGVDENARKSGKKFTATMKANGKEAEELPKNNQGECTATPMTDTEFAALADGTPYWLEVSQKEVDQAVARGEIGKVDRSRCKEENEGGFVGPNKLQINFWNETDSKDVELIKKVTGTLGDLQKEFEFTVTLTGLQGNSSYKIVPVSKKTGVDAPALGNAKNTGLTKDGNDYFVKTAANETTKTFKVVLKSQQSIKIEGLPTEATYTVTEAASDHKASYTVESEGFAYKLAADDTAASLNSKGYRLVVMSDNKITDIRALKDDDLAAARAATGDAKDIVKIVKLANYKKSNTQNGTALAMENPETVDPGDGAVTITFTNHRDIETETGIPGFVFPIVLIGLIALIGLAVMRRRNNVATVNDFEF